MSHHISSEVEIQALSSQRTSHTYGITRRSVVLGALTAAGLCLWTNYTEFVLHSAALVMSNLPMSAFIPFVFWMAINVGLRWFFPDKALSGTELLVILCMGWIVGTVPAIGWTGYWIGIMTAPAYYATPENGWNESFVGDLPGWLFPPAEAVPQLYMGLLADETVPWSAWLSPLIWWLSVAGVMIWMGMCMTVIFRKQWIEHEKLSFPLVTLPQALVEGFNTPGRSIPALFKNGWFWAGFALPGLIAAWNITTYFNEGMERIWLFGPYGMKAFTFANFFPPYGFRILPSLIAFTYFCSMDILLSFWLFGLLATLKIGFMNIFGFSVGLQGQQAASSAIINLESHGALIALAIWSLWIARPHLREVWRRAFARDRTKDPPDGLFSYRTAVLGVIGGFTYLVAWLTVSGQGLLFALCTSMLMSAAYFAVTKFLAASGFAYLFPPDVGGSGLVKTAFGTMNMTNEQLIGLRLHNSGAFVGGSRLLAIPMMPHYVKMMAGVAEKKWMFPSLWIAFAMGVGASFAYALNLFYTVGGDNLGTYTLVTGNTNVYYSLYADINAANRSQPDLQKMLVWLFGMGEVFMLALLRARLTWWPLHPVGLAFQNTQGVRVYQFSAFLAWLIKLLVLRIGGVSLYHKTKPFFLGLLIGYTTGIGISALVDAVWFPGDGHWVHGW
jgi:hypothetical protein